MKPETIPVKRYWAKMSQVIVDAGWYAALASLGDHELPVLDRQHLEGVDRQSVVIRRREVEDARGPHEAAQPLDGRSDLVGLGAARLLDRGVEDEQGVVGVTAECARRLA